MLTCARFPTGNNYSTVRVVVPNVTRLPTVCQPHARISSIFTFVSHAPHRRMQYTVRLEHLIRTKRTPKDGQGESGARRESIVALGLLNVEHFPLNQYGRPVFASTCIDHDSTWLSGSRSSAAAAR